jgi:hypothetical protein
MIQCYQVWRNMDFSTKCWFGGEGFLKGKGGIL